MSEPPGGLPEDAPLPPHLDPRGRRGARGRRGTRGPGERRDATSEAPPAAAASSTVLPRHLDPRRGAPPPATPGPPRRRARGRRILRNGLILLLVLLVVGGAGTLGAMVYFDRRIDRIPVPTLGQGADVDGGDTNYLLVGSDSRAGLTEEELQQANTTANNGDGNLTDTIILLHVPSRGGTPTLVSFPRDSWVELPGGSNGRINTAFALGERQQAGGGPAALVDTVHRLSGLQIDHYLEVGFIAFLRLTDALGGVEVNLCEAAKDSDSGIDLPAGVQRLDGAQALAFVRQRKGLPRGDLDRVARQQYFLGAVARQTLTPSTLLRPDRGLRLADAVTSSIRADEDLSTFDLARLAWRLRATASGGLAFTTVPVADPAATRGGAAVVLLDDAALPGFFAGLSPNDDQSAEEAPATVTIAPSAIRLEVRNGTSRAGLARSAADDLAEQGFSIARTGNAERQDASESVVLHGANRADSAQTVAASVPGAVVREDDSIGANGLVLVVGDSYRGVRAVTVAAPGEEAPAEPEPGADPGAEAPAPPPEDDAGPCIT